MKTTILSEPAAIVTALREHFAECKVTDLCINEPHRFSFTGSLEDADLLICAEVDPSIPRVRLFTSLLGDVAVPFDHCAILANFLCTRTRFIGVVFTEELKNFVFESTLALGEGMCLHSQLETFAEAHMAGVTQLAPLVAQFSRGELDHEQLQLRLLALGL